MAEFKAQILGILLVIAVFGVLFGAFKDLSSKSMEDISNKVSETISNNS